MWAWDFRLLFIDSFETHVNGSLTDFLPVTRVCFPVLSHNYRAKAFSSNMFEMADCYSSSMGEWFQSKNTSESLEWKNKENPSPDSGIIFYPNFRSAFGIFVAVRRRLPVTSASPSKPWSGPSSPNPTTSSPTGPAPRLRLLLRLLFPHPRRPQCPHGGRHRPNHGDIAG